MADWSVIPTIIVPQLNEKTTITFLNDLFNWSNNTQHANVPSTSPGASILRSPQTCFSVDHFNWNSNTQHANVPSTSPGKYTNTIVITVPKYFTWG